MAQNDEQSGEGAPTTASTAHAGHAHGDDVDCQGVATLLTEYVEQGLSSRERASFEEHLKYCPPCIEFMGQYQKASTTCREVLLARVPRDLENKLLSFLRTRCTK